MAFEVRLRRVVGHAVVDDIDHPADAGAAVGQGRRAAQHLDAHRFRRVGGDGVVGRQGAGVDLAHAVLQHQHARAGEAADHGTAGARAVGAGAQARQMPQHVAQAAGHSGLQLLALEHVDAGGGGVEADRVGRGGDDHLGEIRRLGGGTGLGGGGAGIGPAHQTERSGGGQEENAKRHGGPSGKRMAKLL